MRTIGVCILAAVFLLTVSPAQAEICAACHGYATGGEPAPGNGASGVHGGGAGNCNMCHTMHNMQDGFPVDPSHPQGNSWLLVDSAPSDVCLGCHAGYMGNVFGDDPLAPPAEIGGGNFVFLTEDNLNDSHGGAANPISGDAAGHNINAPSHGSAPDATLLHAPGGTFPSVSLGCTSCHDPHGNGNFRMLYGVSEIQGGIYQFANPAPEGSGLSIYHGQESNSRHTAYNRGFSAWCENCHPDFHDNGTRFVHPGDVVLGSIISDVYNAYNGTADAFGGEYSTAYLAAVPFEDMGQDYRSTAGTGSASRIMCLTCHRAHATSAPDAGRWDFNVTFLADDGLESGSYPIPDPYQDEGQRSLCNKCHRKDEFDLVP